MPIKDIAGQTFGQLLVIDRADNARDGTARWNCVCACGERRTIPGPKLRAGLRKSCGCSSPKFKSETLTAPPGPETRTKRIWYGMHARCRPNAKGKDARLYYGKGIRVCARWFDYANFLADMGEAPSGKSIDRKDGNGNYEPGNCKWATCVEQGNNTSANVRIEYGGRTLTVSEWARVIGIKTNTLTYRLRRGWPVERALTECQQ